MKKDVLELLIHKELTGNISVKEQALLTDWIDESEDNKLEYRVVQAIWEASTIQEADLMPVDVDKQWTKLMDKAELKNPNEEKAKVVDLTPRRRSSFAWMKIAAGFILLLGALLVVRTFGPSQQPNTLVESTSHGEVESFEMIDGSSILLNENADLTFFPHIKSERRISLNGEAFFDVARNETKPFIIETPNALIRVLGTSFKVSTEETNETVVSVRHGKVQVTQKDGGKSVILTKGQEVTLHNDFSPIKETMDLTLNGFDGMLEFNDTRLLKAMSLIELKFGKKILWDTNLLANCEVTGKFEGKTLEEIMAILKTVFQIEKIDFNNEIVLMTGGTCN